MMTSPICAPSTSRSWRPNVRSAAGLNSVMRPSWSMVTMLSSADARIAALRASLCLSEASACARSMAGSGAVLEPHAVGIDREHGAQAPGRRVFDDPAEHAQHLAERHALGHHLEQPLLACEQGLGPFVVVDVGEEAVPEVDAAFCVTQGKNARPLPAEGAIRAAQPCFEIEGLSGLNGGSPSGQHFVAIIRMEVVSRSLRLDLFESLAEVFQH